VKVEKESQNRHWERYCRHCVYWLKYSEYWGDCQLKKSPVDLPVHAEWFCGHQKLKRELAAERLGAT
jgi:hypothetical protein